MNTDKLQALKPAPKPCTSNPHTHLQPGQVAQRRHRRLLRRLQVRARQHHLDAEVAKPHDVADTQLHIAVGAQPRAVVPGAAARAQVRQQAAQRLLVADQLQPRLPPCFMIGFCQYLA